MKKNENEVMITINICWPPVFIRISHIYSKCRSSIIKDVG